jgi:hydroxymethylpyrimidine/phosphomethylpyrimidine kinase
MTVAGSDSGGGAGIQGDLKTIMALGGYGVSVITALTAQNGATVNGIHEIPGDFVSQQLETVREGFPVKAAKTGMLFSAAIVEAVAGALRRRDFPLVVDPVCVSQSGCPLLRDDALDAMRSLLLPLADVLTPNKPEAELLSGERIRDSTQLEPALERLHAMGAKAVLLKGGHFTEFEGRESLVDWLSLPGEPPLPLSHNRVSTPNTHGTGCALSAALATGLAFNLNARQAVILAQNFLSRALEASYAPGIGAGPPNPHFV